jgi:hypothetical protein
MPMTEEQKQAARERLALARAKKALTRESAAETRANPYDPDSFGPWLPTHVIGETPVKRVHRDGYLGPSYIDEEGRFHVPAPHHDAPLRNIHEWLENTTGVMRLTLQELALCCSAILDPNHRAEIYGACAMWQGGNKVLFSRTEDGCDIRRYLELPDWVELPCERDLTGQRIDPDPDEELAAAFAEEEPPQDSDDPVGETE